jgi:hypothetical protein
MSCSTTQRSSRCVAPQAGPMFRPSNTPGSLARMHAHAAFSCATSILGAWHVRSRSTEPLSRPAQLLRGMSSRVRVRACRARPHIPKPGGRQLTLQRHPRPPGTSPARREPVHSPRLALDGVLSCMLRIPASASSLSLTSPA